TFGTPAGTLTVASNIIGAISLTKSGGAVAGAAILTLSGANNTYSGGTTLNAGTLILSSPTAIGTGSFTIAAGPVGSTPTLNTVAAGLGLNTTNAQFWNNDFTFTGTGNLQMSGAITLGGV